MSVIRRLLQAAGPSCCAVLLAGCAGRSNVIALDPAARDPVAFQISGRDGGVPDATIYGLSVIRCGTHDAMWSIAGTGGHALPARVVYGSDIPGFLASVKPRPLSPGCYDVVIDDAAPLRFDVQPDGSASVPRA